MHSREFTNFTYELSSLNRAHLAWWLSDVTAIPVRKARGYLAEISSDDALVQHVQAATAASARRRIADQEVRLGRRMGWYALVRALHPSHVIETGTDKGLGSIVLAAALLRNGHGRLTTIDTNDESGYLIGGPYAEVIDRVIGESVDVLQALRGPVDFFLHDSLHTREYELAEFAAVGQWLTPNSLVLSDNADVTDALPTWAEEQGRQFYYFAEQSVNHWFPGGGIGLAKLA